jgi:hypothetical protein
MSEPGACHAVVTDVPASWADYALVAAALGDHAPKGLIVHAAGRTDEGFRILEVWESKEAWQRFREQRLEGVLAEQGPDRPLVEPTLRELAVERLLTSCSAPVGGDGPLEATAETADTGSNALTRRSSS